MYNLSWRKILAAIGVYFYDFSILFRILLEFWIRILTIQVFHIFEAVPSR